MRQKKDSHMHIHEPPIVGGVCTPSTGDVLWDNTVVKLII